METFEPDDDILDLLYRDEEVLDDLPPDPSIDDIDIALDRLMRRRSKAAAYIERFDRTFRLELGRLNARRLEVLGSTLKAVEDQTRQIEHLAAQRFELSGAAGVKLPNGTLSSRPVLPELSVDEQVMYDWLDAAGLVTPELAVLRPKVFIGALRELLDRLAVQFVVNSEDADVQVDTTLPGETGKAIITSIDDDGVTITADIPGLTWTREKARSWKIK